MTFISFHFGWFSNLSSFFSCFTFLTSLSSLILDLLFHCLIERLNLPASWNGLTLSSSQVLTGTAVERVSAVLREPCQVRIDEMPLRPEFVLVVRVRPVLILTVQVEGYHIISDKNLDSTNMCVCVYVCLYSTEPSFLFLVDNIISIHGKLSDSEVFWSRFHKEIRPARLLAINPTFYQASLLDPL